MSDKEKSQFHKAEIAVQEKLGVADMVAQYSAGFVRSEMPDQHREFFTHLPMMIIGTADHKGYPWAMPLFGKPGFIQSPNAKTLDIDTQPELIQTLNLDFNVGQKIGGVGIELHTRRRNRMNGMIKKITNNGFSISVEQSFGNCPQYIQKRELKPIDTVQKKIDTQKLALTNSISTSSIQLIHAADTFFIASRTKTFSDDERCGIDASHRGGKPGFVKIEGDTLTFPDFSGNRFFNTLGNIKSDSRVGLFFPDFTTGNAVFLSGDAEIIWDENAAIEFDGAERLITIKIRNSIYIEAFLPMTGELEEMSPSLTNTGTWHPKQTLNSGYSRFQIIQKIKESQDITSLHLQPADNNAVSNYQAGQFLPIAISSNHNQNAQETLIRRSYTLSRAPKNDAYRISVKREEQGVVSRALHDTLNVGDTVYAAKPTGQFTLKHNDHAIVFLSGGVGITPMIAMLQGLIDDVKNGEKARDVWFIHGTQSSATHAFSSELKKLTNTYPWLRVHTVYSRPLKTDSVDEHYNSQGRIDIHLLKQILPFNNYDFYLCGSEPFMRSLYAGLIDTGVTKKNIFYEFFGEGSIEDNAQNHIPVAKTADVHFTKSNITATWIPENGTLLEFAEQHGLKPMYSCRSGSCGACSCTIESGEVSYQKKPSFNPESGQILMCSARPAENTTTLMLNL